MECLPCSYPPTASGPPGTPRPGTPGYEEALAAHEQAMRRERPRYHDPITGLWVMTARELWERGFCCELGCRHCPYVAR
jgi:hypothetical protein